MWIGIVWQPLPTRTLEAQLVAPQLLLHPFPSLRWLPPLLRSTQLRPALPWRLALALSWMSLKLRSRCRHPRNFRAALVVVDRLRTLRCLRACGQRARLATVQAYAEPVLAEMPQTPGQMLFPREAVPR